MTIAGHILVYSIFAMLGLTVFAYYAANECDPLASGLVNSPNQVSPTRNPAAEQSASTCKRLFITFRFVVYMFFFKCLVYFFLIRF